MSRRLEQLVTVSFEGLQDSMLSFVLSLAKAGSKAVAEGAFSKMQMGKACSHPPPSPSHQGRGAQSCEYVARQVSGVGAQHALSLRYSPGDKLVRPGWTCRSGCDTMPGVKAVPGNVSTRRA